MIVEFPSKTMYVKKKVSERGSTEFQELSRVNTPFVSETFGKKAKCCAIFLFYFFRKKAMR